MSLLNLILFIIQIIVAILLILVVLIQSSDEDSLSGIGASASKSGLLSHKTSVDLITKITIILGSILMINSFILTNIYTRSYRKEIVKDYLKQNKEELLKKENNTINELNKDSIENNNKVDNNSFKENKNIKNK